MKRILLFILASTCLFSGAAFGMKRKRNDGDEGKDPKRRKIAIANPYASLKGSDGKYYCPRCGKQEETETAIEEHVATHGGSLFAKKIPVRKRHKFGKKSVAKKKKTSGKNKTKKNKAPKKLGRRSAVGRLYEKLKNEDGSCVCPTCKKKYNSYGSFCNHRRRYEGKDCRESKRGPKRGAVGHLYEKLKNEDGSCVCPTCGRKYKSYKAFWMHRRRFEGRDCREVPKKAQKINPGHRRQPKGKGYFLYKQDDGFLYCPDCLWRGDGEIRLQGHMYASGHAGHIRKTRYAQYEGADGMYHCSIDGCKCKIYSASDFGKHLRKKHGINTSLLKKSSPEVVWHEDYEGEDKYYCPDCTFSCKKPILLYRHLMTTEHAGSSAYFGACDKYKKGGKYVCPGCNKKFATAYELRIHCEFLRGVRGGRGGVVGCSGVKVLSKEDILQARRGEG